MGELTSDSIELILERTRDYFTTYSGPGMSQEVFILVVPHPHVDGVGYFPSFQHPLTAYSLCQTVALPEGIFTGRMYGTEDVRQLLPNAVIIFKICFPVKFSEPRRDPLERKQKYTHSTNEQ